MERIGPLQIFHLLYILYCGSFTCFVMCGCFDNCVSVLVICVIVFNVFCTVCTVFLYFSFKYIYSYLFCLY